MEYIGTHKINLPKYVGSYQIGGQLSFQLTKKPNYINRLFCKWCLGWKWIDNK